MRDLIDRLKIRAQEHRGFFGSAKDYDLMEEAAAALDKLQAENTALKTQRRPEPYWGGYGPG